VFIIIIYLRRFANKEDKKRYKEKILVKETYFPNNKKIFWIHAASIGETNSVLPLIKEIIKNNENIFILLTSTTLTSSHLVNKNNLNPNNFQHRFFTLDIQFLVKRFLNHWKPNLVMFVDSEIWPNYLMEISKRKIPLALLNGRITMKTFNRWKMFPNLSKKLFSLYNLCLSSSNESEGNLKLLGAKNVKFIGNLKFCPTVKNEKKDINLKLIFNKRLIWCAASTHPEEEEIILKTHKILKQNGIEVMTIIIPRHIIRSEEIYKICNEFKLNTQIIKGRDNILNESEVLIINSIGEMTKYFYNCKSIFMGKSLSKKLIKVGGQNPIEPAKCGCKIYHGPYVSNFKEIFEFLNKKEIAYEVSNEVDLSKKLLQDFNGDANFNKKNLEELNNYGEKVLALTINEVLRLENDF
tara:strand:+ start:238 stop:1467 length:1230 start_codon:yes stop_codon:yes gene_type:complete